jgi:hypothetical protein
MKRASGLIQIVVFYNSESSKYSLLLCVGSNAEDYELYLSKVRVRKLRSTKNRYLCCERYPSWVNLQSRLPLLLQKLASLAILFAALINLSSQCEE